MDGEATVGQKLRIAELCEELCRPTRTGKWPVPFTKADAARMIKALEDVPPYTMMMGVPARNVGLVQP